jgi:thiosulfate reductase cytochrome b subunit
MTILKLKHLLAVRWFHWINFPLLLVMIWSGLLIYWAYDVYHLGPFKVVPRWIFSAFGMDHKLAEGMAIHFFFMWLFAVNGVLYVAYTLWSGEWRYLVPRSSTVFSDAWQAVRHDLGLSKELPLQDKYNAAQQIAYSAIVLMGAGSLMTGLAIYKPAQLAWLTALFGGYAGARLIHFAFTIIFILFFLLHVTLVARAGWNNFRGMVIGYEVAREHD